MTAKIETSPEIRQTLLKLNRALSIVLPFCGADRISAKPGFALQLFYRIGHQTSMKGSKKKRLKNWVEKKSDVGLVRTARAVPAIIAPQIPKAAITPSLPVWLGLHNIQPV